MSREAEIAVLGCGGWGRNIVRTLHELGALRAAADPSAPARARVATLAPGVPCFDDPEPILADPGVRGVMIATPAVTHYDLACRVLATGRDVFVEKPMTIEIAHARDLVRRSDESDRVLMVGHLLEYHPAILALRELVEAGELGEIRYIVSNRLNLGRIRTEESALWSFAPHDIAVILRLVGSEPEEVVATGGSYVSPGIADVTVTQLRFASGVRAHVFVSWLHPFKEQRLVVVGSRRMASFCDVSKELVLYDQRVDWHEGEPVPVKGEGVPVEFRGTAPLEMECRHFIERMADRRTPRTDGRNGLRVLEILHAAQHSLQSRGRPVALAGAMPVSDDAPTIETRFPEPAADVPA